MSIRSIVVTAISVAPVFVAAAAFAQAAPASAPNAAPTSGPAVKATVEETSLGIAGGYGEPRKIAMDPDANHIAFIGVRDNRQVVVLDGKPGPSFDQVVAESLEFSPKGGRLGYLVQSATDTTPVIDGKLAKGYFAIAHNHIFWSEDGKRTAMAAQFQDGGGAVVVDGVEGPHYDSADLPLFSPEGTHVAYIAKRGKDQFVVLDGKEQKAYDAVGRLKFSPSGKHLTFEGVSNGKTVLVLDGQEGKPYDSIRIGPGFSSDSGRLVAVAAQAGKLVVVVNGKESVPYEALLIGDFVLSPDGKHLAYAVKQGNQQFAVIDNVPQPPFDHIGVNSFSFSPDSKRIAYQAGDAGAGHQFIVVDGVKSKPCDVVLPGTPFFSPDSKHVAYGAGFGKSAEDTKFQYVVDGVGGKLYPAGPARPGENPPPGIEVPTAQLFSPDSRRFAYRAFADKKPVAVIDGVESAPFQAIGFLSFSPDSRHISSLRIRDEKTFVMIDDTEAGGPYNAGSPLTRPVTFDDATSAHFIATRKDEFLRVKVKIVP